MMSSVHIRATLEIAMMTEGGSVVLFGARSGNNRQEISSAIYPPSLLSTSRPLFGSVLSSGVRGSAGFETSDPCLEDRVYVVGTRTPPRLMDRL